MPLYKKRWWKRLFDKRPKDKVDVLKDVEAITMFLNEIDSEKDILLEELKKLKELETEYQVTKSEIKRTNLETQARILDKIVQRYEYLQNDTDINGQRVKIMAANLVRRADKNKMKDLAKQKEEDWKFQW